jgi:hypothetical protein
MKQWEKQEIEIAGGAKVMAQVPLIIVTRTPTMPPPLKIGSGIVSVRMRRR